MRSDNEAEMSESLTEKVVRLKQVRNAVILAHNYQLPEVQDIADFAGDSLGLSRQAAKTEAEVIVFCGVDFMAETAAILSPEKKVLMPDLNAGCPMADMITAEDLRRMKTEHPGARVVCYVNSTADVKAESDVCCTSANAVRVVESFDKTEEIIFVPDKYLGAYVQEETGRKLLLWPGYCPTHVRIMPKHIERLKSSHPHAVTMVHPECTPDVRRMADQVLSTGGMCRFAASSQAGEFIVGTETGIIHRLRKENPGRHFYPAAESAVCPNMKRTTLEKVLWSLQDMRHVVTVQEKTAVRARCAIERMLEITG
ncbi:MAG: quinolinate synthase NadA [Kiritimatiellia bacterium]